MENFDTSNKRYRKVGPYILLKPIGRGAYSTVYQAKKQGEPIKYAVKQISLLTVNPKQLERIHSQIKVLSLIKSRNIVCLIDYQQTSRNLYLVFEYCKHTDLEAYIQKYCLNQLPQEKVRKIAIQIKNAFKILRTNKVVHRDLKLANILVTDDFQIKIADFGFAKLLDDDEFFKSYVGTPLTMAPEILQNRSYNEKCDLWSLGIVLYQLLFGRNPFFSKDRMTKTELIAAIKAKLIIPNTISDEAADLLRKLIVRQPTQRISFQDFFKHPWLNQGNIQDNLNQELLEQALRVQLGKCLLSIGKRKEDKQFLLNNSQQLLAYQILQNCRNTIQGKIMFWINLAKKIISINYVNKRLSFLAVAVLISHIKQCQNQEIQACINWNYNLKFPKYMQMRKLIKWQMSEYSKRLPGFIDHSLKKFLEYIDQQTPNHTQLLNDLANQKLIELFLIQLTHQIGKRQQKIQNIEIFLKIKPFTKFYINLRLTSHLYPQKTISLLLRKFKPEVQNNSKMFKRLGGIFNLETLHKDNPQDRVYDMLKALLGE